MVAIVKHGDVPAPAQADQKPQQRAGSLWKLEAIQEFRLAAQDPATDHVADVKLCRFVIGHILNRIARGSQLFKQLPPVVCSGHLQSNVYVGFIVIGVTIVELADRVFSQRSAKFEKAACLLRDGDTENNLTLLANLLGHEGEGSLHAALKQRGWIHSLSGGGGRYDRDNAVVTLNIELTDAGASHIDEITDAVFAYIALIREHGVESTVNTLLAGGESVGPRLAHIRDLLVERFKEIDEVLLESGR